MADKDPVTVLEHKSDAARPPARDAVGAEIPVTIHASRTTQGLGKNLPSVHEDTKTVIVLQQGAVVRLTATLSTGETVVLTNRMTGADVLCRVGKVKSQPGIQHYVDLEFIQRAPNFWGDAIAASSVPIASRAPAPAIPIPAPVTPTAAPVAVLPPPAPVLSPPPSPVAVAAPPPVPVAITPPPVHPAPSLSRQQPGPVVELPPVVATGALQAAPLAEPVAASWKVSQTTSVRPVQTGTNHSTFGSMSSDSAGGGPSASRKTLLAVAAGVVLVLSGAAGGYWFYSQQFRTASSTASQPAADVPSIQAQPDSANLSSAVLEPASEPVPVTLTPPPAAPRMDIIVESRPAIDVSTGRIPPPAISTSARTPAARRNIPVGQLKAPKAKTTTARTGSSVAPPPMIGTFTLGETGAGSSLLVAEAAGPAAPPGSSKPAVGGQLQPPQMINSEPPVYPRIARMQRVGGVVVLDALVDETGKVVETKIISGPQLLVSAAQESVRNWKYKPAQLNGVAIAVHTRVSVRFNLQ